MTAPARTRPYRVWGLDGKWHNFATHERAVIFAHKQAVNSWAQSDHLVWIAGQEDAHCAVTADGTVYDPFGRWTFADAV